jgi:hypothetical protein
VKLFRLTETNKTIATGRKNKLEASNRINHWQTSRQNQGPVKAFLVCNIWRQKKMEKMKLPSPAKTSMLLQPKIDSSRNTQI